MTMRLDPVRGFWEEQAENAVLDWGFDWTEWLKESPGDSIAGSQWAAPDGGTISAPVVAGNKTGCTVSALQAGREYRFVNTITTAAGRADVRVLTLVCK